MTILKLFVLETPDRLVFNSVSLHSGQKIFHTCVIVFGVHFLNTYSSIA